MQTSANTFALASGLIGFRSSTLRVRVTERRNGLVWCRTADLQDAGTPLVLRDDQVRDEPSEFFNVLVHAAGFVGLGEVV